MAAKSGGMFRMAVEEIRAGHEKTHGQLARRHAPRGNCGV
jgi:hypothetical protein